MVWYSNSDDPYYTLRRSGGPLVAVVALPAILAMCAGGAYAGFSLAMLLPGVLVPLAAVAACWEFLYDRRAVVEVRLAGDELTVIHANGKTTTYPVREVSRLEVIRHISGGVPSSITMRLHTGRRVERTRHGPADLPSRWPEAIAVAEIDTQLREKHSSD